MAGPPAWPTHRPSGVDGVLDALRELRDAVAGQHPHPDATAITHRLDDHLAPRLAFPAAPVLIVVGGATGAGKSTLVNSVVRAPVSPAGPLRPTTLAPVLVCHPTDLPWFDAAQVLPDLPRVTGPAPPAGAAGPGGRQRTIPPQLAGRLHLVGAPGLPPGLALLDAPDLDSVVQTNRDLSDRLAGAADLWLFVTTASRYADRVPWAALRAAAAWGVPVAVVLNRVPDGAGDEVSAHLAGMMAEAGLAGAPLFVLPQTALARPGLLPEAAGTALRSWLVDLAGTPAARAALLSASCAGGVAALVDAARRLSCAGGTGADGAARGTGRQDGWAQRHILRAAETVARSWAAVPVGEIFGGRATS